MKRAVLLLTHRCNQVCRHCEFAGGARPIEDPAGARWRAVIDGLARCGLEQLVLTGGEPTLRRDLASLVEHAARRVKKVIVCTNGTRLDRIAIKTAHPDRVQWTVSLHAGRAAAHDAIVGAPGAFARAARGIAALRARIPACRVCLNTVVSKKTDLLPLIRVAARLGARQLCVIPRWVPGRGDARVRAAAQRERALAAAAELELIDLRGLAAPAGGRCLCALSGLVVDAGGNVYPCMPAAGGFRPDARRAAGNVFRDGVEDTLASPLLARLRRQGFLRRLPACASCHAPLRVANTVLESA